MEGEEESGFTILKFTRKYITCDKNDLPITVSEEINLCTRSLVQHCVMVFVSIMLSHRVKQQGYYGASMPLLIPPLKIFNLT